MIRPAITGGMWDCHTHIYGPWDAFPLPATAAYRPAAAPMTDLLAMHERLGIGHGVLVQAACYQSDHSALLAALAATDGRYRGVALVDETMLESDLCALHEGGIRGVRFNFMGHLPGDRDLDRLRMVAERVRPLGWHALLHGHLTQILPALDAWQELDMPIVIDHMARQDATRECDASGLKRLERHLEHPQRWIKLSGIDRMMQGAPAPWNAALPLARRLLAAAPNRAIWGTDWPHPNIQGPVPDDGELLDFLFEACGGAATAQAVLVDNPKRLYF